MTTVLRLLALLLFLVALLTGGCSIGFTVLLIGDPAGSSILPVWAAGLVVGGLCLAAGLGLWRLARRKAAEAETQAPR